MDGSGEMQSARGGRSGRKEESSEGQHAWLFRDGREKREQRGQKKRAERMEELRGWIAFQEALRFFIKWLGLSAWLLPMFGFVCMLWCGVRKMFMATRSPL